MQEETTGGTIEEKEEELLVTGEIEGTVEVETGMMTEIAILAVTVTYLMIEAVGAIEEIATRDGDEVATSRGARVLRRKRRSLRQI